MQAIGKATALYSTGRAGRRTEGRGDPEGGVYVHTYPRDVTLVVVSRLCIRNVTTAQMISLMTTTRLHRSGFVLASPVDAFHDSWLLE